MRRDILYALRFLRRRPGVSALVVGTLAIGIAAATIVFSLADAIIWHPVPFRDADRLVRVRAGLAPPGSFANGPGPIDLGTSIFDGLYPFELNSAIVKVGGESRAVTASAFSQGLLQTLGVSPIRGREFAPDEYVPGNTAAVVSEELLRSIQSVAPSADDHTISVDGVPQTIVGVMPAGFEFPVSRVLLWRPYVPSSAGTRIAAIGKLKPGVTIEQAQASGTAATRGTRERPLSDIQILPFVSVNPATATALRVLSGAVTLLLLIAIANAANIMLAETVRRDAELAVRASLGASWLRLVRQIMCETLLVSALAAIIGLIVSTWALKVIVKTVPYLMSFQALRPIAVDWRVVLFAAAEPVNDIETPGTT